MYRRILVPLDGSRFGEHALPYALGLASRWGAALELVSVALAQGPTQPQPGVVGDESRERAEAAARGYLETVEGRVREAGFEGELEWTVLSPGNVASSLVRHLVEVEGDFAVMTTHGRGPIQRAWLGSTADAFIRTSPVPVLLLRPEEPEEEDGEDAGSEAELEPVLRPFSRILVPLDGSRSAERLLELYEPLAGEDSVLLLLRAVPAFTSGGSPYLPHVVRDEQEQKRFQESAQGYLDGLVEKLDREAGAVETRVLTAVEPAAAILRTISEEAVDLVAMSTEGRGGVARLLLGSVADKVVRGSPVPVLLYRKPGES